MKNEFFDDFLNICIQNINKEENKKKINFIIEPYVKNIERKFNYFMIMLVLLNFLNLFFIYWIIYYYKKNNFEVPNFSISEEI